MEYISIVPPQYEGQFPRSSYRMVLAHWVLDGSYKDYPGACLDGAGYVILDNSAFEDAQPTYPELCAALDILRPQEFVLPNARGDHTETLQRSLDFIAFLYTRDYLRSVMFVPTGHTVDEWTKCLDDWLYEWDICKLSVEKDLIIGVSALKREGTTDPQIGSKVLLLDELTNRSLPSHLLGVPDPAEFFANTLPAAKRAGTRSVDTSLAFALGAKGILLTRSTAKVKLRNPWSYPRLTKHQVSLITRNYGILQWAVSNGTRGTNLNDL